MEIQNDATFVAPEGVYSLTDEIKAPSIGAGAVTTAAITQFHSRLTSIVIKYPQLTSKTGFGALLGIGSGKHQDKEKEKEKERENHKEGSAATDKQSRSSSEDKGSKTDDDTPDTRTSDSPLPTQSPLLPSANQLASPPPLPPTVHSLSRAKSISNTRAKPRHNVKTTSSSFVTRSQSMEGLTRYLTAKQGDTTYVFYNHGRSFFWTEPGTKNKDPLTRLTFTNPPTSHDLNLTTASPQVLDILIAFATGDIIWFHPITSRYHRINKGGVVTSEGITCVRWVKGSHNIFITAHRDGSIVLWDVEREDADKDKEREKEKEKAGFGSTEKSWPKWVKEPPEGWSAQTRIIISTPPWHNLAIPTSPSVASSTSPLFNLALHPGSPTQDFHSPIGGTSPDLTSPQTPQKKEKAAKNPLAHWRLARRAILDFSFAPNSLHMATVSEDGCLRILDLMHERLVDSYGSYFGSLTCVCWSPDGRFVLTGGQDDLLTLYSPYDGRVIARCQGHSSFVSACSFDSMRCVEGKVYRFGSVGEDGRFLLWDFSPSALLRPKHHTHHSSISNNANLITRNGLGIASTVSLPRSAFGMTFPLGSVDTDGSTPDGEGKYHPAPGRNEVPVLESVVVKQIESDIVSHLNFSEKVIMTCSRSGHIKCWVRPLSVGNVDGSKRRKKTEGVILDGVLPNGRRKDT